MSVQSEIERITENVANTYSVLEEAGADMPETKNTVNLPETAASISAVLYKKQTLTKEQKGQARENIGVLEPLIGSTSDITPAQVSVALLEGREVVLAHTDANYGVIYFSGFIEVPALNVVATSGIQTMVVNSVSWTMRFSLAGNISQGLWHFEYDRIADYSDIPNALPNPNALTFTGAVTGTYAGSSAVTINIPTYSGGSSGNTIP